MRIDLKAVRIQGALHGLHESRDADHLIVHSERSLFAIVWAAVQNTPEGVAISLGPERPGKLVATDVAVDNAWVVEPKGQRVLLAREGEFESIDPWGQPEAQKVKMAGLPRGTFAAAIDPEGAHVLLVVVRVINPDAANYGVALADLANARLIREGTIGSGADLELLWDNRLRTWVIGDTSKATLWRWDGARPAVRIAGPAAPGPVHAASFVAGTEGVIVSALFTHNGATGLIAGQAEMDRAVWQPPVALPGPPVLMAKRHPAQAIWACMSQAGTGQQLQIRDAAGKVLAEAAVRPATHLDNLIWSPISPNRVWGFGARALAAATLSE
ncbi:MAG TPA: hypothetical protein VG096_26855 [Bryobacteraceae bacterium]|jgi:hypothetical protein|nr:hypothetical protein [Bryobacteraceae bacterium]